MLGMIFFSRSRSARPGGANSIFPAVVSERLREAKLVVGMYRERCFSRGLEARYSCYKSDFPEEQESLAFAHFHSPKQ